MSRGATPMPGTGIIRLTHPAPRFKMTVSDFDRRLCQSSTMSILGRRHLRQKPVANEGLPTLGRPGNHMRNSLKCLAIAAIDCRLRASTREGTATVPSACPGQGWRAADSHFRPSAEWRVELRESCLAPAFLADGQSDEGPSP